MGLLKSFNYYWYEHVDPRTRDMPLIESPVIIPTMLVLYMFVVLKWGPKYMEHRTPYDLKTYMKFYNIFEIVANTYVVYSFIDAGWFTTISVGCHVPNYSFDRDAYQISYTLWIVTMIKLIDLTETVVFVFRKKNNQITFLHLYHHVSTVLISWLVTKYVAVEMTSFVALLNCFIHVIMYSYYLLSTFGPNVQKRINRFKPMLTIAQMVQFVIMIWHCYETLRPSCPVPRLPGAFQSINVIINFTLFYNFYQKTYVNPKKKKA